MLRRLSLSALIMLALAACQPIDKNLEAEDSHNPHFKKAEGFMEAKNYVDAAKEYEEAIQANPNVAMAHYELGNIYGEKLGDEVSAMYHYSKFLELRPTSDKRELVQSLLENTKYTLATKLPNTPIANAEVFARIQSENANLKKQLEDAQARLARAEQQAKQQQAEINANPAPAPQPTSPVVSAPPTPVVPSPVRPPLATPAPAAPPKAGAPAPTAAAPAAPAAPAPAAPVEARSYTIAKGDTLWSIAKKHYKNDVVNGIEKIKAANADKLGDGKPLKIGTTLVIP